VRDIRKHEDFCIKMLDFKLNNYTCFDVLESLLRNGIIFQDELKDQSSEYINSVYLYPKSILSSIISTKTILEFNPIQIIFSILHLTREKFNFDKKKSKTINNVYKINFNSFSECLDQINWYEYIKFTNI
jgi:hypothetical protein